jgi:NTE family protein
MDRRRFLSHAAAATVIAPGTAAAATRTQTPAARRRALVLTGGGARGAYQAGAIQGLYERGERFDLICGTSIGAINGALVAQGDLDELRHLWESAASHDLVRPVPTLRPLLRALREFREQWRGIVSRPFNVLHGLSILYERGAVLQRTGFLESEPVDAYLREHVTLARIATPFAWSATNLTTARAEAFYVDPIVAKVPDSLLYRFHRLDPQHPQDQQIFPDTIRASAAIPVGFSPVAITPRDTGRTADYVDGGIALNTPIGLARTLGATEIVAIGVDPPSAPARVNGLLDVIFSALETNQSTLLYSQLEDALFSTGLDAVSIVRPSTDVPVGVLDFDRRNELHAAFEQGRADGHAGPRALPIHDVPALERLIEQRG